jgi:polysaccharide export outer membrane protein
MMREMVVLGAIALILGACATSSSQSTLQASQAGELTALPFADAAAVTSEYRIGPLDQLNVTVFQVPDLSVEKVQVDAAGQVQLPLVGTIQVAGMTTNDLAAAVRTKLEPFLQRPQVAVTVAQAASQKVTVDGAVVSAGVFELRGRTSLMQAVAMAKGPSPAANIRRVAVFRTVNGQRMAAVFDLKAIREGKSPDPAILGDDIIVVEGSALKGVWREILAGLPALAIFRPF